MDQHQRFADSTVPSNRFHGQSLSAGRRDIRKPSTRRSSLAARRLRLGGTTAAPRPFQTAGPERQCSPAFIAHSAGLEPKERPLASQRREDYSSAPCGSGYLFALALPLRLPAGAGRRCGGCGVRAARRRSSKHGRVLAEDPPDTRSKRSAPESRHDRFRPQTAASMPTPSPLVVRESGHGAAATRSGVDEQYASRHSARLHCPARDCRRSRRVVRGFAVRAAAASARAWRRLPARHRAPSMQWRALPRPARWSISAWSPSQELNGPAASITAPARSARSFATYTTARPAVLRTIALRGDDDRRSVLMLEPAAPPDPQIRHRPYRPRGPHGDRQAVPVPAPIT